MARGRWTRLPPVSYTHLDVYKRQSYAFGIDLLAALLLALAAVSFCALLRKAAQDRISMFGYGPVSYTHLL